MNLARKKYKICREELFELCGKVAKRLSELTDETSIAELIKLGIKPKDLTGAVKELGDALQIKSDSDEREQKARIKKLESESNEADERDRSIHVIIGSDAEEYSV